MLAFLWSRDLVCFCWSQARQSHKKVLIKGTRIFGFKGGENVSNGKCHYYCSCFIIPFRCYLVDNLANLVTDPDFLLVSTKDAREYERVSLGRKEGDIMKLLVAKYKLFVPNQRVDFQGICSVSPYAPKVCFFFFLLWSSTIRYW